MLLLATNTLPEGGDWTYELKLDGYRAIAFKADGEVHLRSRNDKDFALRYPAIAAALKELPDNTVVDGEIVAFDDAGRPSFTVLQNYGSSNAPICYYVFDVLVLKGRDLRGEQLDTRREMLSSSVLPRLSEPIRFSPQLEASLPDLIASVREQMFEGLVAKNRASRYEAGERTGAWLKMRVNQEHAFVIGGYTVSPKTFDALVFGYYEGDKLLYVGRTRNGFTPASRAKLFQRFRELATSHCPFANLPEAKSGRWGFGLTAAKMKDCRWLKPTLIGQFEFAEWTPENHLRHSRFIGLLEDRKATQLTRN